MTADKVASRGQATIDAIDLDAFLTGNQTQRTKIAIQVDQICRDTGFLIINNHGVAPHIIADVWRDTSQFFTLPITEKMHSAAADPNCPRGYFPQNSEALAGSLGIETPPDHKESFSCGPLQPPDKPLTDQDLYFHYGDNLWPEKPNTLKRSYIAYYNAMITLGEQLLSLFAAALNLPEDYFVHLHAYPMAAMRGISYPCIENLPKPGQLGAGDHSDYGSITILKPDPHVAGLEIRLPSGQWLAAPLVKDGFIINIGDMLARWTNDRWVSTRHRVISPVADPSSTHEPSRLTRQSIAFFHNTNFDANIECITTCLEPGEKPKYPPIQAGEYLAQRFLAAKS